MKLPFLLLIPLFTACTKAPTPPAIAQSEAQMTANLKNPDYMKQARLAYHNVCSRCHGENGEGGTGPNLTDAYWIYGDGKLMTLVETIQKGAPENGMPAWEAISTQADIELTAAHVFSIIGSHPKNSKAPQGQLK